MIALALRLEDKKAIVKAVHQSARDALSLVIADARGVAAGDMTALRREARSLSVELRVVKNSLARRALSGTDFDCACGSLSGPSFFGFSMEDPGAAARLFKGFAKEHKEFSVKTLSFDGRLMDAGQLDLLATLPTLDEARARLCHMMLAPIAGLARTLNEVPAQAVRALHQVGRGKSS